MRISDKRFPIVVAILAALFLCTISEPAQAQTTPWAPTTFNAQNCMQNMQIALSRNAQDRSANSTKVFAAGQLISMKGVYCWSTVIAPLWKLIAGFEAAAATLSSGGIFAAVGTAIVDFIMAKLEDIITSVINGICSMIGGVINMAIASAYSFVRSLLCLPLPHFNLHFSLNTSFLAGSTCNGVSAIDMVGALGGHRRAIPGAWGMWGFSRQP